MKRRLLCIGLGIVLALAAWVGADLWLSGRPLHLDAAEVTQIDFRIDPQRNGQWTLRDAGAIARIVEELNALALRPRDRGATDSDPSRYSLALRSPDLRLDVTANSVEVFDSGNSRYNGTYPADTAALLAALGAAGE